MVEAILMQCPPLPDSALILFFPFHCDSYWDWLLGDHIQGTKRAQLVWTGLSDTTSCSWCESLPSMQAFGFKKRQINFLPVYIPSLGLNWKHDRLNSSVCVCVCLCVCVCACVCGFERFVCNRQKGGSGWAP